MSQHDHFDEQLIARVERVLRAQPLQKAPPDLIENVYQQLARNAARSWWQRSFSTWPPVMQAVFVLTSLTAARIVYWVLASPDRYGVSSHFMTQRPPWLWWDSAAQGLERGHALLHALGAALPTAWWYVGAATLIGFYIVCVLCGALVYRSMVRPIVTYEGCLL
jgi:hypothetical protein